MRKAFLNNKVLSLSLTVLIAAEGSLLPALAAGTDVITGGVGVTITPANIQEILPIDGANRKVTMSFRDIEIQDAMRALAKKGGFNVLIDESVQGSISVDLNNVTIQAALETLKTYGNLAYDVQGRNLMVASAESAKGQAFLKTVTRMIPLRHANAKMTADLLNKTVFADRASAGGSSPGSSGGSQNGMPVTADSHTNSLIVVGTPTDVKTVQEHVAALDQPREMRTWRLSQANVLDVATMLSSSLFNEGQPALVVGSSASGGAGGSGPMASTMRVTAENIQDGSGASQSSQSGGSGGSSGGSSGGVVNSMTLRGRVKETQTAQISPNGPIIIPDTRLNSLTLLGTAEQIAMAESLIPTMDRKVPQVVLEASLIEVTEEGRKELGFSMGANESDLSVGVNTGGTRLINRAFSNVVGRTTSATTPLESIYRFSTGSARTISDFVYQLNGLVNKNKAKLLAHPTVVTSSDNEAIVSIVDEILRSVTVTQGTNGGATVTHNIGEAGIVLNILPKIGADRTVNLRVRPVISTVLGTQQSLGNQVTLLSKREVLAQNAVMQDGETFVLAGLIHDTNTDAVTRDPILSRLPIVGALGRNSTKSKRKSELVILITPHILNDESGVTRYAKVPGSQLVPSSLAQARRQAGPVTGSEPGMVPVSLTGNSRPSSLPPLGQVNVIGKPSSDIAMPELKPAASTGRNPGSLRPEEMRATPSVSARGGTGGKFVGGAAPTEAFPEKPTAPTRSRPNLSTPPNISDDAIRAIMNKFK